MGTSTVAQLIARGKAENAYNNSGIKTDAQWLDFFNDALRDLVSDLNIQKQLSINFNNAAREYDLPTDFYRVVELYDGNGYICDKRRIYGTSIMYALRGYWIMYRGSKWVIDLYHYTGAQTFTGLYQSYAAALSATTDTPDVPDAGERALIYFALAKSLRNNNQVGMAQEMEAKYEMERKKIRAAAYGGVA